MVTKDEIDFSDTNPAGAVSAYLGAKALSERKLWDVAQANPEVDFTSSNLPYFASDGVYW